MAQRSARKKSLSKGTEEEHKKTQKLPPTAKQIDFLLPSQVDKRSMKDIKFLLYNEAEQNMTKDFDEMLQHVLKKESDCLEELRKFNEEKKTFAKQHPDKVRVRNCIVEKS